MIEIIIFHFQDTNVQSETFSKELLHDISHATQLSILHVSKVTKFSPECVAHEILIGSFSIDDGNSGENVSFKMNSRFLNLCRVYYGNWRRVSLELIS